VALASVMLGGCATAPQVADLVSGPARFRSIDGAPPVSDGRAGFRRVFCDGLRAEGLAAGDDPHCDRWLWRLADEPSPGDAAPAATATPTRTTIFLVTGAFSECVGEEARPFAAGAARLRAAGARVETLVVGGRSGTAHNARQIAEAIGRAPVAEDQTVIVIGYSKGVLDALRFLVDFPALAERVDAVVSVAGPVFGSPLADKAAAPYSALLAKFPYDRCPPGDGDVLESLRPSTAVPWLESNRLPREVRYYSLAGFTTRERVARALVPSWRYLNRTDIRNDGQVMAADAVIPGSTLLAYVNADHWGISETIETVHGFAAARPDPEPLPLDSLLFAIVAFVSGDIATDREWRDSGGTTEAGGNAPPRSSGMMTTLRPAASVDESQSLACGVDPSAHRVLRREGRDLRSGHDR
jgi:hypothetical protein